METGWVIYYSFPLLFAGHMADKEIHFCKNRVHISVMLSWVIIGLSDDFLLLLFLLFLKVQTNRTKQHLMWQTEVLNRRKGTDSTVTVFFIDTLKLRTQINPAMKLGTIVAYSIRNKFTEIVHPLQRNSLNTFDPFWYFVMFCVRFRCMQNERNKLYPKYILDNVYKFC